MLDRMCVGDVARKHHIQLRGAAGELRYEECYTRDGFEGPYTILYHLRRPHTQRIAELHHGWNAPEAAEPRHLAKRHYRTPELAQSGGPQIDGRIPLLFNDDLIVGVAFPTAPDPVYVSDGDADQLVYVHQGAGTLRSPLGDVTFNQGDYVFVPRGLLHRFLPEATPQHWLWFSLIGGLHVPKQWRNDVGQLRMDAPYSHRDFKRPVFYAPRDEGIEHARGGRLDAAVEGEGATNDGDLHRFAMTRSISGKSASRAAW